MSLPSLALQYFLQYFSLAILVRVLSITLEFTYKFTWKKNTNSAAYHLPNEQCDVMWSANQLVGIFTIFTFFFGYA